MNRTALPCSLALLLGTALVFPGCGVPNTDTNTKTETESEEAAVAAPQEPAVPVVQPTPEELEQRAAALEERERALAAREKSLATARRSAPASRGPQPEVHPIVAQRPVTEAVQPALRKVMLDLPASTALQVEFRDALSSETSAAGDPVQARVAQDVFWRGYRAIPAGSVVVGTVAEARPQKKFGGQAALSVEFQRIDLPSGEHLPIQASFAAVGKRQAGKDAATIGGSAAGGALLGRILSKDKKKGTLAGAVVGGAVGAAVAANNAGDPVNIEPGFTAELQLATPVQIAVTERSGPAAVAAGR